MAGRRGRNGVAIIDKRRYNDVTVMLWLTERRVDEKGQEMGKNTGYDGFVDRLREAATKWFKSKGYETDLNHSFVLPRKDDWPKNIIYQDVAHYVKEQNLPLHRWIHDGSSSQAMIFNLIGPLVVRNDLDPLKHAIEHSELTWPDGEITPAFEYSRRCVLNEIGGTPTTFDIALLSQNNSLFVEAKLTETDFGKCSFSKGDCNGENPHPLDRLDTCHLHVKQRKYWDLLRDYGLAESRIFASEGECPLKRHYQFFREVLFTLAKGGSFVLLHDNRNPYFTGTASDDLWPQLIDTIPEGLRDRVGRLTIQSVVRAIEKLGGHEDWIGSFKEKYGLQHPDQR
jgi:POLQ-like helicase